LPPEIISICWRRRKRPNRWIGFLSTWRRAPHLLGDFTVTGEVTLGDLAATYGVTADAEQSKLTLADYFDIHLDHAPKEGATLALDPIVLVARSISGGRVNVVGLRLPEEEEDAAPSTRRARFKRKLSEMWTSVAGI